MNEQMSTEQYWTEIYTGKSNAQPGGSEGDRFAEVMKRIVPHRKILDVAAGYATLAKRIANLSDALEVTALDICQAAADRSGYKPYVIAEADQHIPFEDKSFDLVICCQGMGYMADPPGFLREARRVGHRLLLTVSNGEPKAGVRWPWTVETLRPLLAEYGTIEELFVLETGPIFANVDLG